MKMATFAGNIGFKISCQLPSRVFSISRTIWKCQIVCLKGRDYNSSVAVKHIPKTSSKVKIPGREDVLGRTVHCGSSQYPNQIRNNFLFDGSKDGCEQVKEVAEADQHLTIHQAGESCEHDLIGIGKFTNDAEDLAIKLLAARALTAVELRKKLLGKKFSPNAVDAVINKFESRGLINDRLYAESFSQSRWSSLSWGPRRIKQALFKKGVSQADANKAVEVVFKNSNDCDEDQVSVIGLSKHSMDHLYTQASKQWCRGQNVSKETRKSRIVRWLQYRGFDWNVINYILKKLDRQEQDQDQDPS